MVNNIKEELSLEESLRKKIQRNFNLFNKKEIEKATQHLNNEMDEAAEEFYKTKKDKEKDDSFER